MDIEHSTKCKEIFVAHLKDELTDVEKYAELYDALEAQGFHDEADDIEEIARDEFKHATIIYDILDDWGYDIHQHHDITMMWHKAKEIFHMR